MKISSGAALGPLRTWAFGAGLAAAMALPAGAGSLPAPYVSRALDAVLIRIDASVQQAFGLAAGETGVLVLAVAPGGVADSAGVVPGDVIGKVHDRAITDPITLDEVVYYYILKNAFDFGFDGWTGGKPRTYTSVITAESYRTVIDITMISTWSSYSSESFSYAEYTAEYSSEISESYAASESTVEEATSAESFAAEETSSEAGVAEGSDGTGETAEPSADDAAATDSAADDTPANEQAADDSAADDAGGDTGGGDTGGDDTSGDSGGDSGGDE